MPYTYIIKGDGFQTLRSSRFINTIMPKLKERHLKLLLFMCHVNGSTTLDDFCENYNANATDIYISIKKLSDLGAINIKEDGNTIEVYLNSSYPIDTDNKDNAILIKEAESIYGKPLSTSMIASILYAKKELSMPSEIVLHLVKYCINNGAFNSKYFDSVAIAWTEKGVSSVEQADLLSTRFPKYVYSTLRNLGYVENPAPAEAEIIIGWHDNLKMPDELIDEACRLAVFAHAKNRLVYANKILESWHKSNFMTMDDINAHKQASAVRNTNNTNTLKKGHFAMEHDYDYDSLEKELLERQRKKTSKAGNGTSQPFQKPSIL